jgi:thiaminase/transcriptional activator TenA
LERLSEKLRKDSWSVWEKILNHPFVIELYKGSLPIEKFKFYVKQDYNYLIGSMRAFSLLASKADYELAKLALEIAHADATIEMGNYIRLLDELDLSLDEVLKEEPAPTNVAYVNFLLTTCYIGDVLECLVSLLPCYWSYQVIAETHKDLLQVNPNSIYVKWAKVYLSKEYKEIVDKLREAADNLWDGSKYEKLKKIFLTASRYEYMFWDMAYNLETWPV